MTYLERLSSAYINTKNKFNVILLKPIQDLIET